MMMTAVGPPVDAHLVRRAEALVTTGEYLRVLIEVAGDITRGVRESLRTHGHALHADSNDWRQIEVLLNIADDQAKIVLDVGRDFDVAQIVRPEGA